MAIGNIKKCKLCSNLFEYRGVEFCTECMEKIDEAFVTIRDYVYQFPNASTQEIIDETGVDGRYVNYLLKSGRLKAVARNAGSSCERCGKHTTSGRYCPECAQKLAKVFGIKSNSGGAKSAREATGITMHSFKRDN